MKKLFLFAITLFCAGGLYAQGFGIGVSGSYFTELDGLGGTADLIYEFNENWGASTSFSFAAADDTGVRAKWTIVDLSARYSVIDDLYLLAGGQYLSVNLKELGLGGGNPLGSDRIDGSDEFGFHAGTGYVYNLVDNVNVFAEVRYAFVDSGYVHGKLGLRFDF